ncbi:D-isomer specific 2-hydroxyacid dehydrogenase [Hypoxylon sp. FL1150]|nr:D-isomer specific 2-hydroxyacid dehydrogenase [Hypoxylon sp. FL1150]
MSLFRTFHYRCLSTFWSKDAAATLPPLQSFRNARAVRQQKRTMAQTHHVVVALESFFVPVPKLDLPAPHTYELREYERTYPDQVAQRIKDADILISAVAPIGADVLSPEVSPRLKMVAIVASGTDAVDLDACRARGIVVTNSPHCNTVAVAEHAIALYFAARRSLVLSHTLVQANEWPRRGGLQKTLNGPDGKPPKTCRDETLGIVGYGAVGKMVESMAKGLGMKVLISGRKGSATAPEGRTPFETLIRESSVILICLPRSPESVNLISEAELASMKPYALIINVSRGLIVNEKALLAALKNRKIAGYATDVYAQEPASAENSPLVGPDTAGLNLITTPHVAWIAEDTIDKLHDALKANIGGLLSTGEPKYRVA